ncbi:hypothetical protein GGX14DRAFT_385326 [Mycena pura]|uniref:Uncharacterized protein n=1 Tax=Mycena pura TaxID=153505 RepID=A0AAD6YTK9_9AGAR|nr:hypothetical protein GGX14DRAFT_385326 [Mycena pura]
MPKKYRVGPYWLYYMRKRPQQGKEKYKSHFLPHFRNKYASRQRNTRLVALKFRIKMLGLYLSRLTELQRSESGIYLRFARGVANSLYKDNQVFLGLVQTMQMATERHVRGVGLSPRNFGWRLNALFAMQPLYDGPAKTWLLIGLPGESQLTVTMPDELERLMDVPHLPATKISASELTKYQLLAMTGLAERKLRFISNLADGAAVEQSCQEQRAKVGTKMVHTIDPPTTRLEESPIGVPLYHLAGNTYVNA